MLITISKNEQKKLDAEKIPKKNEIVNEVVSAELDNEVVGSNLFHILPV